MKGISTENDLNSSSISLLFLLFFFCGRLCSVAVCFLSYWNFCVLEKNVEQLIAIICHTWTKSNINVAHSITMYPLNLHWHKLYQMTFADFLWFRINFALFTFDLWAFICFRTFFVFFFLEMKFTLTRHCKCWFYDNTLLMSHKLYTAILFSSIRPNCK